MEVGVYPDNQRGPGSPEDTPEGIPFNVGMWLGLDGTGVIAAFNPGGYGSNVYTDLSKEPTSPLPASAPQLTGEERTHLTPQQANAIARQRPVEQNWFQRIDLDGKVTDVFADYHYVGTGDIGGATQEANVKLLEAIVTKSETILPSPPSSALVMGEASRSQPTGSEVRVGEGPVHVVESAADQMFNDIAPANGIEAAEISRESRVDQSLSGFADIPGIPQALDYQE